MITIFAYVFNIFLSVLKIPLIWRFPLTPDVEIIATSVLFCFFSPTV